MIMSVLTEMIIEREMCQLNRWRNDDVNVWEVGGAVNAFN